ncbi:MAG TPA: PfkB family carbohydrate kinase [Verrucomicrobiae bacterium]|nr:PfkB family carbohydrate kinase [Verrucomicrobiae bacterium]
MKQPIVLALNPSIDAEWQVARVRWEEKNAVLAERRWAGGKGVNVARWLKFLGARPRLILPLGGDTGRQLAALLRAESITASIIALRPANRPALRQRSPGGTGSETRVNVIISTAAQGQLRFNPPGPVLDRSAWDTLCQRVRAALPRAGCLILSGSLPRGLPVNAYARLVREARVNGVPALLDCDGPALAAAVPARPFLVKPNEHELLEWARHSGVKARARTTTVRTAALAMSRLTRGWVLVSRGARPALLVNASFSFEATAVPPPVRPQNTVGAGDALLAAVAHQIQHDLPPERWLTRGVEIGTAATQLPAGVLPRA